MSEFTNTAIYIKRAETHHTEEYIKNAFKRNLYGIVKSVTFVQKTNEFGQKYNGVLVVMEYWFKSQPVNNLFEAISEQKNKEYKMFHNNQNRYWIVIKYTNTVNENPIVNLNVDSTLDSAERIRQLELMVDSMSVQMSQLQKTNKLQEEVITSQENGIINKELVINELMIQLEDKNYINKCLEIKLDESNFERSNLTNKLISLHEKIENTNLDTTIPRDILQEIDDMRNMIAYYELQDNTQNNNPERSINVSSMTDDEIYEYYKERLMYQMMNMNK